MLGLYCSILKVFDLQKKLCVEIWGCSSAGRAPALHAGGQEFDPPHLHHTCEGESGAERNGLIAQVVRAHA